MTCWRGKEATRSRDRSYSAVDIIGVPVAKPRWPMMECGVQRTKVFSLKTPPISISRTRETPRSSRSEISEPITYLRFSLFLAVLIDRILSLPSGPLSLWLHSFRPIETVTVATLLPVWRLDPPECPAPPPLNPSCSVSQAGGDGFIVVRGNLMLLSTSLWAMGLVEYIDKSLSC